MQDHQDDANHGTPTKGWPGLLQAQGLQFDNPAEEQRFAKEYVEDYRQFHQLSIFLGIMLYYIFFLWDRIIDPVNYGYTQAIRGLVFAPMGLVCIGLLQLDRMRKAHEWLVITTLTLANMGLTVIYCILTDGMNYGSVGIVLVTLFTFMLLRVRFVFYLLYSVATLVAFNLGQWYANTQAGMFGINNLCVVSAALMGLFAAFHRERDMRRKFVVEDELRAAKRKVEELLYSMLPDDIVRRINLGEKVIADSYGEVSIVFADLVGFTHLARKLSPNHLVETLNQLFSEFDQLAAKFQIEKIKTIGDAYMAISGVGKDKEGQAERAADFAIGIREIVARMSDRNDFDMHVRIGLHIGPVVAGVIGSARPAFDCWGDAVNLASRLEASARSGAIHISEQAYWRLRDTFVIEQGEDVDLKGMGKTPSFALLGRRGAGTATGY
ncbi:adenylate/guanylate cyclase domain-containing protein [Rhodoferax sp. AJA081-3]|uniref:adenylate/guanylate cyclase domain-containing protein n=1 Tax=Rhodoferax sp. AJA081-3 TaxID=2752316 RepID=UPI001AE03664|nr:adenylate/guanylate cyclase domain-containing protein [Rhodoferax sp. AJA081-3]QTN29778.1 adenylate/guanylate cyclase domain-containing protein [Rhodoferax sp. AJA081-3]